MPQLKCPYCKSLDTKKTDGVRETLKGYRRRYQCINCDRRFTSYEEWCPEPISGTGGNHKRTVKLKTRSLDRYKEN